MLQYLSHTLRITGNSNARAKIAFLELRCRGPKGESFQEVLQADSCHVTKESTSGVPVHVSADTGERHLFGKRYLWHVTIALPTPKTSFRQGFTGVSAFLNDGKHKWPDFWHLPPKHSTKKIILWQTWAFVHIRQHSRREFHSPLILKYDETYFLFLAAASIHPKIGIFTMTYVAQTRT